MQPLRILLVQLGSTGDCLLITPILRQIKLVDYPNCYLKLMVCTPYKHVFENNPYINEIVEIPLMKLDQLWIERNKIDSFINGLEEFERFDKKIVTDYYPNNLKNWYYTTRSSLFRSYPNEITVDIHPDIFLKSKEIKRVKDFCFLNKINNSFINILIESSPRSRQSNMDHLKAISIAEYLISKYENIKCIISSSNEFTHINDRIIDASVLSFRENKELLLNCNLLIGSSSAISWMCSSSTEFPNLKMIQSISKSYEKKIVSASLIKDLKYFGVSTRHIIELIDPTEMQLIDCINLVLKKGFFNARNIYFLKNIYFQTKRSFLFYLKKYLKRQKK
jgi:ADP-heptose:LPS heptosyltransferase